VIKALHRPPGAWLGADPGLLRLRLALRATLAVAAIAGVMRLLGPLHGVPTVVATLIGGMVGMQGSFAVSGQAPKEGARTLVAFPLVTGVAALPAAGLSGHRPAQLVGFAVAAVIAVFVRRWGVRAFLYGMLGWFSYFFTLFVGFTLDTLPGLLLVVTVATAIMVLVGAVLVPDRPSATHRAARAGFDVRVRQFCATAADVLQSGAGPEDARRRLHARCFRLVEASLIVDAHLGDQDPSHALAERRLLLRIEVAAERVAAAVVASRPQPLDPRLPQTLQALAEAESPRPSAPAVDGPVGTAVRELVERLTTLEELDSGLPEHVESFESAVTLASGNLPNSTPSVLDVLDQVQARLSLNSRLCVQTAVAVPVTLLLGELLSARRYYWAVLACFLVLTGTFTTAERVRKGADRVLGTVGGLVAATVAVHLTGRSDTAVIGVMLVCVFVGLYLFRVSYAAMTFAVTTLMGELYNVLGEFSGSLLLLRLEETTLGACVALITVLGVLPIRGEQAKAAAQRGFQATLDEVLAAVADRLRTPVRSTDLLWDVRRLDSQLHQVAILARPSAGPLLLGLSRPRAWRVLSPYSAVAYRVRDLVLQVVDVEPGGHPELATRLQQLSQPAERLAPAGSGLERAVDELEDAVAQLHLDAPEATAEPVATTAGRAR
jgi:uncharacterized membrane protein YccC